MNFNRFPENDSGDLIARSQRDSDATPEPTEGGAKARNDLRAGAERLRQSHPAAQHRQPPEDRDHRLATLSRGADVQVRVSLGDYEGHKYLNIREWTCDGGGGWWPSKRGLTIRVRELPDFADGVAQAIELLARHAETRR